jgi:hypothetical protein
MMICCGGADEHAPSNVGPPTSAIKNTIRLRMSFSPLPAKTGVLAPFRVSRVGLSRERGEIRQAPRFSLRRGGQRRDLLLACASERKGRAHY